MKVYNIPENPRILTTTVGSYSYPEWLLTMPNEQSRIDALRVVFDTQRQFGIDLITNGELNRFDPNHPDTNGMIEYFVSRLSGIKTQISITEWREFQKNERLSFRRKPAGVVIDKIGEGYLNLYEDCTRSASLANAPFKFTVTSPYMLARTLQDNYYYDFEKLVISIAEVLSSQLSDLPCACVQIDEANIPGNPNDSDLCSKAINLLLDKIQVEKAVHLCFGNYGGQTIQKGTWKALVGFLNNLNCDHLVLELKHRPIEDLDSLKLIDTRIKIGIGVIDIKSNHIETPDEIAFLIDTAEEKLGPDRIRFVHPDCGFWMLKRSVADRKMEALVRGRDRYLGI
ncbi:MAG TPA: cobalamin-independent methionine synthase II family protein [Bacteroidota bacterium]|nr:cobalamin-independent methionine synthase II family protein [Bacteroidota bacterium]